MKQVFLSGIQLLLSVLLITGTASAQKTLAKNTVVKTQPFESSESVTENSDETIRTATDVTGIHVRAVKNFNRDYKNVTNAKWYNSAKTIVASFNEGGKSNTVVYYKNGRWLHTLINYDESHLAEDVRSLINENFDKFKITWVTEVHEADKVMYFVNIENEKRFKQVYVCNGEFGIYKDYRKGN
jgi:hypothetical protein